MYQLDFARVSFWVQLCGLPLGAMNIVKPMSALGEVLEVEDSMVDGNLLRSFIRVRVYFNVNNPSPYWLLGDKERHAKALGFSKV